MTVYYVSYSLGGKSYEERVGDHRDAEMEADKLKALGATCVRIYGLGA